jgi:hypothetical protein
MYPYPIKLYPSGKPIVAIDRVTVSGDLAIGVELESDGGTGEVVTTFEIHGRSCQLYLDPDSALGLSEALAFYANASKRSEAAALRRSLEAAAP